MDFQRAFQPVEASSKQSELTQRDELTSPLEALKSLSETVTEALLACLKGEQAQASDQLALALPKLLAAMTALGMEPSPLHSSSPDPVSESQRLIHIDGNRVEVWVDNEIRGSWSIWSVADLKEVCRLAEEFDCGLVYSFMGSLSPSKSDPIHPAFLTPASTASTGLTHSPSNGADPI